AISVSWPSVRIVAISMMRSRTGSSPVICMSSQTRTSLPAIPALYNSAVWGRRVVERIGLVQSRGVSLAGPAADRAGVHVDEAALGVEADAAELLGLGPGLEHLGRHAGHVEVDRVAVGVLAVARDLVALL